MRYWDDTPFLQTKWLEYRPGYWCRGRYHIGRINVRDYRLSFAGSPINHFPTLDAAQVAAEIHQSVQETHHD